MKPISSEEASKANAELNEAIRLFGGWKMPDFPTEDRERVVKRFGELRGKRLAFSADFILFEMNECTPNWSELHSSEAAHRWIRGEMQKRHPELEDETLDALAWTFSWWRK